MIDTAATEGDIHPISSTQTGLMRVETAPDHGSPGVAREALKLSLRNSLGNYSLIAMAKRVHLCALKSRPLHCRPPAVSPNVVPARWPSRSGREQQIRAAGSIWPVCPAPPSVAFKFDNERGGGQSYSPVEARVAKMLNRLLGHGWADAFKIGQTHSDSDRLAFSGQSPTGPRGDVVLQQDPARTLRPNFNSDQRRDARTRGQRHRPFEESRSPLHRASAQRGKRKGLPDTAIRLSKKRHCRQ